MSDIQPIEPNAVYTTDEAAALLRIGVTRLQNLARSGDITATRVGTPAAGSNRGTSYRFLGANLLAFLASGRAAEPDRPGGDAIRRRGPRPVEAVAS